jgi:hypothetical protein
LIDSTAFLDSFVILALEFYNDSVYDPSMTNLFAEDDEFDARNRILTPQTCSSIQPCSPSTQSTVPVAVIAVVVVLVLIAAVAAVLLILWSRRKKAIEENRQDANYLFQQGNDKGQPSTKKEAEGSQWKPAAPNH